MRLYKRDYTKLTVEDRNQLEKNKVESSLKLNEKKFEINITNKLLFSKGIKHYQSLFPNNYLDPDDLIMKDKLGQINQRFVKLIDNRSTKERDILAFIKNEEAYHIIGAILADNYNFGHHSTYLFPEFELPASYKSDFLLIGRRSGGHEFLFIEFEEVYGQIATQDGSFGLAIRKGLKQIEDWEFWLESNFHSMKIIFEKYKSENEQLPREFYNFDKTRVHYALVAGRRGDFKETTYRNQRIKRQDSDINVFHYDNLIDLSNKIIGQKSY